MFLNFVLPKELGDDAVDAELEVSQKGEYDPDFKKQELAGAPQAPMAMLRDEVV